MTTYLLLRWLHIAMGTLALAAGASSMLLRKGSRAHARSGTVFFGAMMVMAGSGTLLAASVRPNAGNVMGGLLASYLTLTAWATVWRAPRQTGRLEVVAALLGVATAGLGLRWGLEAVGAARRMLDGYPYQLYLAFGGVALVGALLDARMIVRGGFAGAARTTRHLTRMCLAMYMATASFFLGQAKLFPETVRRSGVLTIPVLLVIAALLYWLVRLRLWPMLRGMRSRRPLAQLR
jgi:hypothetical protein